MSRTTTGIETDAEPRGQSYADPTIGLLAWAASCGGIAALATASLPILVLALPLGIGSILLSVAILRNATAHGGPGAGHGLAGLITAGLGLTMAGILALAPTTLTSSLAPPLLGGGPTASATPLPSPPSGTSPAPTHRPVALHPAGVEASATAAPSTDASGNPVTFDAGNVVDGDRTTAWRVDGDGVGATLTFTFDRPVHLTAIGVVPGYAKVDPANQVNRFFQNRRVTAARYSASSGWAVDVTFSDEATMQVLRVSTDASSVEIEITGSSPNADRDFTAISEVGFAGWVTG
jgi:hypothetical protein